MERRDAMIKERTIGENRSEFDVLFREISDGNNLNLYESVERVRSLEGTHFCVHLPDIL